jgi:hypothetical protein
MVKHFVFVSSAGAYKANSIEPMHVEGDERKGSAGHVAVENYLKQVGRAKGGWSLGCVMGRRAGLGCRVRRCGQCGFAGPAFFGFAPPASGRPAVACGKASAACCWRTPKALLAMCARL